MKFLIVSHRGDGAGLAWKLHQEGHEVFMYMKDPRARGILKGVVTPVSSIRLGVNEGPDVILFDMVGFGKEADKLNDEGWRVIGGGVWNDKLELDRKFASKVMETFGIPTPRSYAFRNLTDAMEFVKAHNKLLVLKPFDNRNTAYTHVPRSNDELLGYMEHLKRDVGVNGRMLLQEFVKGTELSTEVWYQNGKPLPHPNSTLETKKFLTWDYGPSTGCQTSFVFGYPTKEPRVIQQSLKKLAPFMERIRYTGPLDINGILRKGRFYGLEFSPRFGYSALYAWMRLLEMPMGEFLDELAAGAREEIPLKKGFGFSLRVSLPPYPYQSEDPKVNEAVFKETKNLPILGVKKWDTIYPLDCYQSKGRWYTAGFDGAVCECTGYGESVVDAESEAIQSFKQLQLPHKQARIGDASRNAMRRLGDLSVQGYDVPPFELPKVETMVVEVKRSSKEEPKEGKNETLALANKFGARPGAFADPRVKSN